MLPKSDDDDIQLLKANHTKQLLIFTITYDIFTHIVFVFL